jgi:tRNA G18 (ribose-2'-O)-methylase SpoU
MARVIEINNLNDSGLEVFAHLTEVQLRNHLEPEKGIFIAEGETVIDLALKAGCEPLSLLMERKRIEKLDKSLVERCGDIPIYTGERDVLAGLTGYTLTRGILGAFRRPVLSSPQDLCKKAKRLAVLDGITDSTNVGAIIRSAAALNVDGVLVMTSCCDPLCRRSVRVSMGTIFQIPWTMMADDITLLKQWGFKTAAMALSDKAISIEDHSLVAEPKLALVFGSEGYGLAPKTMEACDYIVKIPMSHQVDSLNVAAASAVAFWQLRIRQ